MGNMTSEELEQILSMGSLDEQIAELLRRQEEAEAAGKATLDVPSGQMVGRSYVADVPGQISNMFIRGQAKKRAEGARTEREEALKKREAAQRVFTEGLLGRNLEPIQPSTPRVGTPPPVDTALAEAALAQPMRPAPGSMRPMPDRIPQGARPNPEVPPPGARQPAPPMLPGPSALPSNGPLNAQAVIDELRGQRRDALPGELDEDLLSLLQKLGGL